MREVLERALATGSNQARHEHHAEGRLGDGRAYFGIIIHIFHLDRPAQRVDVQQRRPAARRGEHGRVPVEQPAGLGRLGCVNIINKNTEVHGHGRDEDDGHGREPRRHAAAPPC